MWLKTDFQKCLLHPLLWHGDIENPSIDLPQVEEVQKLVVELQEQMLDVQLKVNYTLPEQLEDLKAKVRIMSIQNVDN